MWIYEQQDDKEWAVGFFDPDGFFQPESIWNQQRLAAARVHFLNGGDDIERTAERIEHCQRLRHVDNVAELTGAYAR